MLNYLDFEFNLRQFTFDVMPLLVIFGIAFLSIIFEKVLNKSGKEDTANTLRIITFLTCMMFVIGMIGKLFYKDLMLWIKGVY